MTDKFPHIWTRRPHIVEPRSELVLPIRFQGFYQIEAGKLDGRRRLLADWFPNLIVDAGLNQIGENPQWMEEARVGTGTNSPTAGDTALQTQVAATKSLESRSLGAQSSAPYYGNVTSTWRFGEGVAEGNLAEVGLGREAGDLFSRSRILDNEGNPTTITVLSDEFLDVTYEMRCYAPAADVLDTIDFGGSDLIRDYTLRASDANDATSWSIIRAVNLSGTGRQDGAEGYVSGAGQAVAYDGTIGAVTASPSGSSDFSTSITKQAYTEDNFYLDSLCTWGLNDANFGTGVRSFSFQLGDYAGFTVGSQVGRLGKFQVELDTSLPKDDTKILAVTFRLAWSPVVVSS